MTDAVIDRPAGAVTDLVCPDCGALMEYRFPRDGVRWKNPRYVCTAEPERHGTHGAHPDGRPMGVPADRATRRARMRAHAAFDTLWKPGPAKKQRERRGLAYEALRGHLNMTADECHIGRFTLEDCARVEAFVEMWNRPDADTCEPGRGGKGGTMPRKGANAGRRLPRAKKADTVPPPASSPAAATQPATNAPRLSRTLDKPRLPHRCQSCGGGWRDKNPLRRFVEYDIDADGKDVLAKKPPLVVLCTSSAEGWIAPHPRLYRELSPGEPFPGGMSVCLTCRFRAGNQCENTAATVNGGSGLVYAWKDDAQPTSAHLNYGGGKGEFTTIYPGPVKTCSGFELGYPKAWWVTFDKGPPGCVETAGEAEHAMRLAAQLGGLSKPILARHIPYPATPRLNPPETQSKCPPFCYKPGECAQAGRCCAPRACDD